MRKIILSLCLLSAPATAAPPFGDPTVPSTKLYSTVPAAQNPPVKDEQPKSAPQPEGVVVPCLVSQSLIIYLADRSGIAAQLQQAVLTAAQASKACGAK